jgi:hypothetical protein
LEKPGVDGREIFKHIFGTGRGMKWILLPQDRHRWETLVNVVMNLRVA